MTLLTSNQKKYVFPILIPVSMNKTCGIYEKKVQIQINTTFSPEQRQFCFCPQIFSL